MGAQPLEQNGRVTAANAVPLDGATTAAVSSRAGYFRWVICALLLAGTTKNYMDRQVLGLLKPMLQHDLGWNEIDYSNLVFAFQAAYALGMVFVGRLVDRLGTRLGYSLTMIFWSLASMGHALVNSLFGFGIARFALGFGEAGVFPASLKTTAEWFPKKERAFATGIFNSGTSIGAIVTPLIVPPIALHWGWRWTFVITGALGFLWLVFWLLLYRKPDEHPRVNPGELAYIRSDPVTAGNEISLEEIDRLPANVGVCGDEVHHRSDLVVLSFLGAGLFASRSWIDAGADERTDRGDLSYFGCWQHVWRVVVVGDAASRK